MTSVKYYSPEYTTLHDHHRGRLLIVLLVCVNSVLCTLHTLSLILEIVFGDKHTYLSLFPSPLSPSLPPFLLPYFLLAFFHQEG